MKLLSKENASRAVRILLFSTTTALGLHFIAPEIAGACGDPNNKNCENYRGYTATLVTTGRRIDVSIVGNLPLTDKQKFDIGYGMRASRRVLWEGYWTNWGDRGGNFDVSGAANGKPVEGKIFCQTDALIKGGRTTCSGTVFVIP